jgi:predicted RNA polymerase sigma factor
VVNYLHKGGLLNRLERFDDAMQLYEQALRTQEGQDKAAG